jgi:hypothetical protein
MCSPFFYASDDTKPFSNFVSFPHPIAELFILKLAKSLKYYRTFKIHYIAFN